MTTGELDAGASVGATVEEARSTLATPMYLAIVRLGKLACTCGRVNDDQKIAVDDYDDQLISGV